MHLRSMAAIALCLLAFACKKESGNKDPGKTPTGTEVSNGNATPGSTGNPGKSGAIGEGVVPGGLSKTCRVEVKCDQKLPDPGPALGFQNSSYTSWAKLGPFHRARDMFANEGADVPLIAKFAYGLGVDKDVKGEPVDIYMSLGCDKGWKKIGSQTTSQDPKKGETPRVFDGIQDQGGYVATTLSALGIKNLAAGRYRFAFILRGNNEVVESYIEVLPKKNAIILSDIDGTLTAFEEAAATEVIGIQPDAHDGAAEMMHAFYNRGYNIFYLTARPAFLGQKTRNWLRDKKFPPGIIHTTSLVQGAVGEAAANFKVAELALLKKNTGVVPAYAFGNKPSDVKAFADSGVDLKNSWFFKIEGDTTGALHHDNYRTIMVPKAEASVSLCP